MFGGGQANKSADPASEVERILASIDPSLLQETDLNLPETTCSDNEDEEEDDADAAHLPDSVDPELLKELNEIAVDVKSKNSNISSSHQIANQEMSNEDPELLKELALLGGLKPQDSKDIEAISRELRDFNSNQTQEDSKNTKLSTKELKERQFELKKQAVNYKRNGDLEMAKKLMAEAKQLNPELELLEENPLKPPSIETKKPDKAPQPNIQPSTKEIKEPKLPSLADQFDSLTNSIENQKEQAEQLARQFFRLGDKSNALRFQRYRKGFIAQLDQLKENRHCLNPSLPPVRTEEVTYSLPTEELDIGPNVLELHLGRAWGLTHPQLGVQPPDTYIQYTLGFAPPGAPNGNTGYTPVTYSSSDPNFDFTTKLGVDGSRVWQRHAERKSLTLEVFHYRGFLFRAWSLGKALIPLSPLLSHASEERTVELLNPNTRKPNGARLEVRLRLRKPILPQQPRRITLNWVVVLPHVATTSHLEANSNNEQGVKKSPSESEDTSIMDKKEPKLEEAQRLSNVDESQDEILLEFYDINLIVARPVLELELERLGPSPPGPIPEALGGWDADSRRSELELKLQMLDLKAQLGQIDPVVYLKDLNTTIVHHRSLALKLKRHPSLLPLTKQVMVRIQLMQREVDELIAMGISSN